MGASPMNVVTVGSVEVASNTDTPEQMRAALSDGTPEAAPPDQAGSEKAAESLSPGTADKADTKEAAPEAPERNEDGTFKAKEAKSDDKAEKAEPEKAEPSKKDHKGDPRYDPGAAVRLAKREAKEAKERAANLEAQLAAERASRAPAKPEKEAAPAAQTARAAPEDADPEPNPDDPKYAEGQFDPAYIKDAGRWAARQEWREQQAKTAEKNRREGLQRFVEERGAKVEQAIQEAGGDEFLESLDPDVRAIEPSFLALARGEKPTARHALGDEFLRMGEQAPRLMRYLTEHPDVFQRLTAPTLSPYQFEREMGRIEAQLGAAATAGTPRRVEVSQAKPPVRPVAGSPHTTTDEISDELPFSKWLAAMNRKEGKSARL